ncbi:tetratricopeptide repeat-containing sensor histidine kinase [Mucilaginibacter kameinonensis]|uniref:tetratricopeptide repeat-containing sensor histidine kinase n=1 Tax=Mucilaginibacter kameinonensis TaxID=452286 RepID=UPI000EF7AADF|nr:sensor histidine kinase [Mucilaginibacter kameinonensis]
MVYLKVNALLVFLFLAICFQTIDAKAQNADSIAHDFKVRISNAGSDSDRISLWLELGQKYRALSSKYQYRAVAAFKKAVSLSKRPPFTNSENECLLQLAVQYGVVENFSACRETYSKLIKYYQDRNDLKQCLSVYGALQWRLRIGLKINTGMLHEASAILFKEKALAVQLKDTLQVINCIKDLGDVNLNLGNLNISEQFLLDALHRFQEVHYQKLRDTYFLLAAVYHLKGNLNKELFYCLAMVDEARAVKDTVDLINGTYKLGRVYEDLEMFENSLSAYQQELALNSNRMEFHGYGTYYRICLILIAQHKPLAALRLLKEKIDMHPPMTPANQKIYYRAMAACYLSLKRFHLAEYYLHKMIAIGYIDYGLAGVNFEMILLENKQLCEYYLAIKDYTRARAYLKMALAFPLFNVSAITQRDMEFIEFKIDSGTNHIRSALSHYQAYKRLNDSIYSVRTNIGVAQIQNIYENSQKDKNIQLLKKQSVIEQERYRRKKTTGNFLIASIGFLLLLLAVLYNRYLLKRRNVVILQDKQQEISVKNKDLEKLLHENEWLLKEIHHRVKNNLHTITGLLNSQIRYLKDETALSALMDSQHRVNAMSLIHQKLYKYENFASIYLPEYIEELTDYLAESFKTKRRILFKANIAPIELDVVYAIPVGLILNEVITNAVKHAFPHGDNDAVDIKLTVSDDDEIKLTIADNGRGMPVNFELSRNKSFGMVLIMGLVEDLNGTFQLQKNHGTSITIIFKILRKNEQFSDPDF